MSQVRLQKFLASAGAASRRKAEELIQAGRVTVNGTIVKELGTKIDPGTDAVAVDGRSIASAEPVWIALHKPRGYVSTRHDPQGRPTIYDLLPESLHTLFHVGRLDYDSEGLMLLTNAGDQAHRLLHPSFEVPRVYDAIVKGAVGAETVRRLLRGVELEDGVARAESVRLLPSNRPDESRVRLALREGRKREVRRMMSAVGNDVRRLKRISYGPIKLGDLTAGKWRRLSDNELAALR
ncbi:MAG: pseudouridine synthase [Gemmatimonadota bacterium]